MKAKEVHQALSKGVLSDGHHVVSINHNVLMVLMKQYRLCRPSTRLCQDCRYSTCARSAALGMLLSAGRFVSEAANSCILG